MDDRTHNRIDDLVSRIVQEVDYDIWKEMFPEGGYWGGDRDELRYIVIDWLSRYSIYYDEDGELVIE